MKLSRLLPHALSRKIIYGYGAMAVLVVGLSAFSLHGGHISFTCTSDAGMQ